jgi:hypothetical protein
MKNFFSRKLAIYCQCLRARIDWLHLIRIKLKASEKIRFERQKSQAKITDSVVNRDSVAIDFSKQSSGLSRPLTGQDYVCSLAFSCTWK